MRRSHVAALAALVVVANLSAVASSQAPGVDAALGTWRSVQQFEGDAKLTFAFKRTDRDITGWATLLGQTRKGNNNATLMLTFYGAKWDKDRLRFDTMLPEDGGTLGWELRPESATRARLTTLTLNGEPLDDDDLVWEMVR